MTEKKQIAQQIKEQTELADYLQDKAKRYLLWRKFVLNDVKALKRRLVLCK